jgi:hypothetical protein
MRQAGACDIVAAQGLQRGPAGFVQPDELMAAKHVDGDHVITPSMLSRPP